MRHNDSDSIRLTGFLPPLLDVTTEPFTCVALPLATGAALGAAPGEAGREPKHGKNNMYKLHHRIHIQKYKCFNKC